MERGSCWPEVGVILPLCAPDSPPLAEFTSKPKSPCRQAVLRKDLNLVLVHPQIPQNAGSVARTCAATSVALHLVRPLGFEIDSRK